jgi:hypothetical protein
MTKVPASRTDKNIIIRIDMALKEFIIAALLEANGNLII